jgi:hypothetical protein
LSDVFSGIAIGLEHAYKPGDLLWVEGGIEGQVLQINWRSTQIATLHNSVAIVPNSIMAKSRLENRSAPTPSRGVTVRVDVAAAVDPQRCLAALGAAVQACRAPLAQPEPKINCVGLQGDGITYEVSFVVATSREIAPARTEMLAQMHRHLRHAGISLAISGIAPPPSVGVPPLAELMAGSDLFGPLTAEEQTLIRDHVVAVTREPGETLIREGEMPEALFLLSAGTLDLTQGQGADKRVLSRASPGDSVGVRQRPVVRRAVLRRNIKSEPVIDFSNVIGEGVHNAKRFAHPLANIAEHGKAQRVLLDCAYGIIWLFGTDRHHARARRRDAGQGGLIGLEL